MKHERTSFSYINYFIMKVNLLKSTRYRIILITICSGFFLSIYGYTKPELPLEQPPNVLFIIVDDLRPQLGCYGKTDMISPNIDKLAANGVLFNKGYCNVPVCGASRASLLTGLRPNRTRFWDHKTYAEKDAPGIITLPEYFKSNGYYTISNGKVFHHPNDEKQAWSEAPWRPANTSTEEGESGKTTKDIGPAFSMKDVPDNTYADGQIADKTINDLQKLQKMNKPFFLAVGFMKPHLPFIAPKKYWDLYPMQAVGLANNPFITKNAPKEAIHNFGELRSYNNVPDEGPINDTLARKLRQGYFSCVSYTDAQVGKVLAELERTGLSKNTIVVLIGDHGWNLGEHTLWSKHSEFNNAINTPLIVHLPGQQKGKIINSLTEFLDIYPTLCELAKLPLPAHLEGKSFVSLLTAPGSPKFKDAVYPRFKTGESICTSRYVYTEYYDAEGKTVSRMLYDHQNDPQENINISEWPDKQVIVKELSAKLGKMVKEGKE